MNSFFSKLKDALILARGNVEAVDWKYQGTEATKTVGRVAVKTVAILINIILTIILVAAITGAIVGVAAVVYLTNFIDDDISNFEVMVSQQSYTTIFYTVDEHGGYDELEGQNLHGQYNRIWADYEIMPRHLIDAFIAIEDRRFMDHNGVDWRRTVNATMGFMSGNIDSGGSTLTQQLIKNITGDMDNTPQRKIQEIFRAVNLERSMTKQEIIELYLNTIYLSMGNYGVQAASWRFFGKCVSELTLIESAAIASITQFPTRWNPVLNPAQNQIRRDTILVEMYTQGRITRAEFDQAHEQVLVLHNPNASDQNSNDEENDLGQQFVQPVTTWYIDAVINEMRDIFMERYNITSGAATRMVFSGGYRVITAMDPAVQATMEEVFEDHALVARITGFRHTLLQPQASMIILHPITGSVLGVVGARGEKTQSRLFCYATQATRQPGSAIKPLTSYAPALEAGRITYSMGINDRPFRTINNRPWPINVTVNNFRGWTSVRNAMARSVNTIPVWIIDGLGVDRSFEFLTETLNVTTLVESDRDLAPLALGGMTHGMTLQELTAGFTIFTNDGLYTQSRTVLRIYDHGWERVVENTPITNVALSVENAAIMRQLLHDAVNLSIGTGGRARISGFETFGKTGTSQNNHDRLFVGFTPHYLGGVWFGYSIPQTQRPTVAGQGNPALRIWHEVMDRLHRQIPAGQRITSIPHPQGVVNATFCVRSGVLPSPRCGGTGRGFYTNATRPTTHCNLC